MNLLNWTITVIGIGVSWIALLFALFQYTNKRGSPKSRVVKKAMYLGAGVLLVFYIIGIFAWVESNKIEIPLSAEEKEIFKTNVFSIVGMFSFDPIDKPLNSKNTLENLIKEVEKNPQYEKEMPNETAILYRLYGASTIYSGLKPGANLHEYTQRALLYLDKSLRLNKSIWEKPHEKSSYDFFKRLSKNKKNPVLEDLFFAMFTIAMVTADESRVREKLKPALDMMMGLAGKPKTDFEYFKNFSGNSRFTYEQLITALRIMIEGQGGRFQGPIFGPTTNGETFIKYVAYPKNKPSISLEWIVDKNKTKIEPKTIYAKDLYQIIQGKKETP